MMCEGAKMDNTYDQLLEKLGALYRCLPGEAFPIGPEQTAPRTLPAVPSVTLGTTSFRRSRCASLSAFDAPSTSSTGSASKLLSHQRMIAAGSSWWVTAGTSSNSNETTPLSGEQQRAAGGEVGGLRFPITAVEHGTHPVKRVVVQHHDANLHLLETITNNCADGLPVSILLEGARGSGKSTMLLDVCRQWGWEHALAAGNTRSRGVSPLPARQASTLSFSSATRLSARWKAVLYVSINDVLCDSITLSQEGSTMKGDNVASHAQATLQAVSATLLRLRRETQSELRKNNNKVSVNVTQPSISSIGDTPPTTCSNDSEEEDALLTPKNLFTALCSGVGDAAAVATLNDVLLLVDFDSHAVEDISSQMHPQSAVLDALLALFPHCVIAATSPLRDCQTSSTYFKTKTFRSRITLGGFAHSPLQQLLPFVALHFATTAITTTTTTTTTTKHSSPTTPEALQLCNKHLLNWFGSHPRRFAALVNAATTTLPHHHRASHTKNTRWPLSIPHHCCVDGMALMSTPLILHSVTHAIMRDEDMLAMVQWGRLCAETLLNIVVVPGWGRDECLTDSVDLLPCVIPDLRNSAPVRALAACDLVTVTANHRGEEERDGGVVMRIPNVVLLASAAWFVVHGVHQHVSGLLMHDNESPAAASSNTPAAVSEEVLIEMLVKLGTAGSGSALVSRYMWEAIVSIMPANVDGNAAEATRIEEVNRLGGSEDHQMVAFRCVIAALVAVARPSGTPRSPQLPPAASGNRRVSKWMQAVNSAAVMPPHEHSTTSMTVWTNEVDVAHRCAKLELLTQAEKYLHILVTHCERVGSSNDDVRQPSDATLRPQQQDGFASWCSLLADDVHAACADPMKAHYNDVVKVGGSLTSPAQAPYFVRVICEAAAANASLGSSAGSAVSASLAQLLDNSVSLNGSEVADNSPLLAASLQCIEAQLDLSRDWLTFHEAIKCSTTSRRLSTPAGALLALLDSSVAVNDNSDAAATSDEEHRDDHMYLGVAMRTIATSVRASRHSRTLLYCSAARICVAFTKEVETLLSSPSTTSLLRQCTTDQDVMLHQLQLVNVCSWVTSAYSAFFIPLAQHLVTSPTLCAGGGVDDVGCCHASAAQTALEELSLVLRATIALAAFHAGHLKTCDLRQQAGASPPPHVLLANLIEACIVTTLNVLCSASVPLFAHNCAHLDGLWTTMWAMLKCSDGGDGGGSAAVGWLSEMLPPSFDHQGWSALASNNRARKGSATESISSPLFVHSRQVGGVSQLDVKSAAIGADLLPAPPLEAHPLLPTPPVALLDVNLLADVLMELGNLPNAGDKENGSSPSLSRQSSSVIFSSASTVVDTSARVGPHPAGHSSAAATLHLRHLRAGDTRAATLLLRRLSLLLEPSHNALFVDLLKCSDVAHVVGAYEGWMHSPSQEAHNVTDPQRAPPTAGGSLEEFLWSLGAAITLHLQFLNDMDGKTSKSKSHRKNSCWVQQANSLVWDITCALVQLDTNIRTSTTATTAPSVGDALRGPPQTQLQRRRHQQLQRRHVRQTHIMVLLRWERLTGRLCNTTMHSVRDEAYSWDRWRHDAFLLGAWSSVLPLPSGTRAPSTASAPSSLPPAPAVEQLAQSDGNSKMKKSAVSAFVRCLCSPLQRNLIDNCCVRFDWSENERKSDASAALSVDPAICAGFYVSRLVVLWQASNASRLTDAIRAEFAAHIEKIHVKAQVLQRATDPKASSVNFDRLLRTLAAPQKDRSCHDRPQLHLGEVPAQKLLLEGVITVCPHGCTLAMLLPLPAKHHHHHRNSPTGAGGVESAATEALQSATVRHWAHELLESVETDVKSIGGCVCQWKRLLENITLDINHHVNVLQQSTTGAPLAASSPQCGMLFEDLFLAHQHSSAAVVRALGHCFGKYADARKATSSHHRRQVEENMTQGAHSRNGIEGVAAWLQDSVFPLVLWHRKDSLPAAASHVVKILDKTLRVLLDVGADSSTLVVTFLKALERNSSEKSATATPPSGEQLRPQSASTATATATLGPSWMQKLVSAQQPVQQPAPHLQVSPPQAQTSFVHFSAMCLLAKQCAMSDGKYSQLIADIAADVFRKMTAVAELFHRDQQIAEAFSSLVASLMEAMYALRLPNQWCQTATSCGPVSPSTTATFETLVERCVNAAVVASPRLKLVWVRLVTIIHLATSFMPSTPNTATIVVPLLANIIAETSSGVKLEPRLHVWEIGMVTSVLQMMSGAIHHVDTTSTPSSTDARSARRRRREVIEALEHHWRRCPPPTLANVFDAMESSLKDRSARVRLAALAAIQVAARAMISKKHVGSAAPCREGEGISLASVSQMQREQQLHSAIAAAALDDSDILVKTRSRSVLASLALLALKVNISVVQSSRMAIDFAQPARVLEHAVLAHLSSHIVGSARQAKWDLAAHIMDVYCGVLEDLSQLAASCTIITQQADADGVQDFMERMLLAASTSCRDVVMFLQRQLLPTPNSSACASTPAPVGSLIAALGRIVRAACACCTSQPLLTKSCASLLKLRTWEWTIGCLSENPSYGASAGAYQHEQCRKEHDLVACAIVEMFEALFTFQHLQLSSEALGATTAQSCDVLRRLRPVTSAHQTLHRRIGAIWGNIGTSLVNDEKPRLEIAHDVLDEVNRWVTTASTPQQPASYATSACCVGAQVAAAMETLGGFLSVTVLGDDVHRGRDSITSNFATRRTLLAEAIAANPSQLHALMKAALLCLASLPHVGASELLIVTLETPPASLSWIGASCVLQLLTAAGPAAGDYVLQCAATQRSSNMITTSACVVAASILIYPHTSRRFPTTTTEVARLTFAMCLAWSSPSPLQQELLVLRDDTIKVDRQLSMWSTQCINDAPTRAFQSESTTALHSVCDAFLSLLNEHALHKHLNGADVCAFGVTLLRHSKETPRGATLGKRLIDGLLQLAPSARLEVNTGIGQLHGDSGLLFTWVPVRVVTLSTSTPPLLIYQVEGPQTMTTFASAVIWNSTMVQALTDCVTRTPHDHSRNDAPPLRIPFLPHQPHTDDTTHYNAQQDHQDGVSVFYFSGVVVGGPASPIVEASMTPHNGTAADCIVLQINTCGRPAATLYMWAWAAPPTSTGGVAADVHWNTAWVTSPKSLQQVRCRIASEALWKGCAVSAVQRRYRVKEFPSCSPEEVIQWFSGEADMSIRSVTGLMKQRRPASSSSPAMRGSVVVTLDTFLGDDLDALRSLIAEDAAWAFRMAYVVSQQQSTQPPIMERSDSELLPPVALPPVTNTAQQPASNTAAARLIFTSPYQAVLHRTIRAHLHSVFTASVVVSSGVVSHSSASVLGKVGSAIASVASSVPIIGGALSALGAVLQAVDQLSEQQKLDNIRSVCVTEVEAALLFEAIADELVQRGDIAAPLVFTSCQGRLDGWIRRCTDILDSAIRLVSGAVESTPPLDMLDDDSSSTPRASVATVDVRGDPAIPASPINPLVRQNTSQLPSSLSSRHNTASTVMTDDTTASLSQVDAAKRRYADALSHGAMIATVVLEWFASGGHHQKHRYALHSRSHRHRHGGGGHNQLTPSVPSRCAQHVAATVRALMPPPDTQAVTSDDDNSAAHLGSTRAGVNTAVVAVAGSSTSSSSSFVATGAPGGGAAAHGSVSGNRVVGGDKATCGGGCCHQ